MISVVVPVYNGDKFIERCINSLKAQTLKNFEVVVVDNNSKDDTANIVQDICKDDSRFVYHFLSRPGVSKARNMGMSLAKGDYIFFLDADDEISPDALEKLEAASKKYKCDIVVPNYLNTDEQNSILCDRQDVMSLLVTDDDVKQFYMQKLPTYLLHSVFKLYSKDFLQYHSIIFDPTLSLGEDLLFNVAAFSYAQSVYYLNKPLLIHYFYDSGLQTKYRKNLVEIKVMLHDTFSEHLKAKGLFSNTYYELLLNDIYSMVVNEKKYTKIKALFELDCFKELVESNVFKDLSFSKKIIFIFIKLKLPLPLQMSVLVWNFLKTRNALPA